MDSQLDAVADLGPFDVVLATDVVFNVDLVDPLIRCLRRCVKPRRGIAWVCLQERCPDAFAAFREKCRQEFDAREVPSDEVGFVDRECVLFELRATGTGTGRTNDGAEGKGGSVNRSARRASGRKDDRAEEGEGAFLGRGDYRCDGSTRPSRRRVRFAMRSNVAPARRQGEGKE